MPYIVTTVHDPVALAAACRQAYLPAPREGCIQLDPQEVSGWIVLVRGTRFPIVCNTLTGLIAYHSSDNGFGRYGCIMRFVFNYYAVAARLRQGECGRARSRRAHPSSHARLVGHRHLATASC